MAARKRRSQDDETRRRPATTLEGRENQLISKAMDLAERKIEDGTASSQEVTHFLKLGSSRELLEQERLRHENELTLVKIEAQKAHTRIEELYGEAIKAMRNYAGDVQESFEDAED